MSKATLLVGGGVLLLFVWFVYSLIMRYGWLNIVVGSFVSVSVLVLSYFTIRVFVGGTHG